MVPKVFHSIVKLILNKKTPLWMIIAYLSFVIPVAVVTVTIPILGGLIYNACMLSEQAVCSFPPNNMWVISKGLEWSIYLDIALLFFAYISWKCDHYIPWLYKKFGRRFKEDL